MAVNKIIIGRVVGADGEQGAQGAPGAQGEQGKSFRYKGTWTPDVQYLNSTTIQDVVTYDGSMYVCLQTHQRTATPDEDTNYWNLLVEKGQKGDTGDIAIRFEDKVSTVITTTATYNWTRVFKASNIQSVTIDIPLCDNGYFSAVTFRSGNATTLTINNNESDYDLKLYMYGFETSGYVPSPNKDITILFTCDGLAIRGYILEG